MAITYNNLYMDIRQIFHDAGLIAATLEAREIVCYASGKTREQLSRDGRLYVPDVIEQQARALMQRHLDGEPVAYLIGEWEFYGLPLDISESVLIPRPDTEVLVDEAIKFISKMENPRVLDLCSGSGCIGLAIASQCPSARVILGEIDEQALKICRQNIRRNNLQGQVIPLQIDALSKPPIHVGKVDCIVCNPPYIPSADIETLDVSVKDYEPHLALDGGADGLDYYRQICKIWPDVMPAGAMLFFEVGIGQADDVLRIMRSVGFGDLEIIPDTNGIARVVYGKLYEEI